MNFGYIANFFAEHVQGGAELADESLLLLLFSKGHDIEKYLCHTFKIPRKDDGRFYLIGNRTHLSHEAKAWLISHGRYALLEHDHQYLKTRDPSSFPEFKAPTTYLKDEELFNSAAAVFCPSALHKRAIEANLPNANVISFGTSFWGPTQLETLRLLAASEEPKEKRATILKSENPIKGTQKSIEWCKQKNVNYKLVSPTSFEKMMLEVAGGTLFVFHPQTMETFSRVCAEAKMVGCKVATTPAKIGFFSEPGLSSLSGLDLIEAIEERMHDAAETIEEIAGEVLNKKQQEEDLTCILSVYRRPHLLREQLQAIQNQTIVPKHIIVYINEHEDNKNFDFSFLPKDIRIIRSSFNFKYHGRIAAAMLAETEFVAWFDDDTIPGKKWFENCFNTWEEVDGGIIGTAGVVLHGMNYREHHRVGWAAPNNDIQECDLVGHATFTARDVLVHFWKEPMLTTETGEDIHLSAMAKRYGKERTYVPPHPPGDKSLWGSIKGYEYGIDEVASSHPEKHERFYALRDKMVTEYIKNGWKTVRKI